MPGRVKTSLPTCEDYNEAAADMRDDPSLGYAEIARRLGVSERTVYRQIPQSDIPPRIAKGPAGRNAMLALQGKRWCCLCKSPQNVEEFKYDRSRCVSCCRQQAKTNYRKYIRDDPQRYAAVLESNARYFQTAEGRAARARGVDRRRAALVQAFVEDVDRAKVWARDLGRCGICGRPCEAAAWHLDHIIPLSKGGTHEYANVQVAHPKCNMHKSAALPAVK